ncbi:MAG TPA: cytochrome c [Gammaproteobacteria bacterium]|jgi:cytochrome c556
MALVVAFTALAACAGGGGPSYDPDSPEGQAYEYRDAVMYLAGVRMQLINNMAREQIDLDEAAFVKAATELATLTAMMPEGFGTDVLVAESLSEPSIWENIDDFNARMNNAIEATAALAEAAQTGGFAAAQQLVVGSPTTSSNCSNCHNAYRRSATD